jgi:hypothetical protein
MKKGKSVAAKPAVANSVVCCVSILTFVTAASAARPAGQGANGKHVLPGAFLQAHSAEGDRQARMRKLDESQAEGEERLVEKNAAIDYCTSQYKNDKTIGKLVKECAKYEEQPVVKQRVVAECQLAAFNYANALHTLKGEFRK